ncbi:lanthionine synthetase C family protein [Crossiella sp. NPDC003009]
MADPAAVVAQVLRFTEQTKHPMEWCYPSFSHGHAGLALLHVHAAAAAPGEAERDRSLETGFAFLREAFAGTQVQPLEGPSVFSGTSGLALCVAGCAEFEPRFRPSLGRLHDQLTAQLAELAPPRVERGVSDSDYDMISGAAGVLAYLCSVPEPEQALRTAAHELLDYLIWLGEPPRDLTLTRRWLIAPELCAPLGEHSRDYPGGYLNLGMAHGIPGAVAALAVAWQRGLRRPGQQEALRRMTDWLLEVRRADEHGPVWPTEIPAEVTGAEIRPSAPRDQLAWCYGSAGVAVSLLAAGDALGDGGLRTAAIEAFDAVLRRSAAVGVPSPTFCHGLAGLLAISMEFAAAGSPLARERTPELLDELLRLADPALPLVFRDREEPDNLVDGPGVLSGSPGVALTLLAALSPRRPSWLHAFLVR